MPHRVQTNRSSTKNQRPAPGTREPGELYVNLADLQLGVTNATKNSQDLIAVRFFSSSTNYVIGDFVVQAGRGYRAKEAITAGAFNAAQWETIDIAGDAEPPIAAGTTSQYWRGDKSWQLLDKNAVGLSQVDNTSDANKPVSSAQQTALNLKANLASPTFTGDPKAPTPTFPDNDTSIATTAFVSGNFAPILSPIFGGDPRSVTPATSDNDTSIATTAYVKANLVPYAPLDLPVFTGNPTAPTPAAADSDTSIATTAFVQGAVGNKITDAPSDGLTYGRKNATWATVIGGASMLDAPPDPPLQNGQLWFETDTGNTYAYYVDPTGVPGQWIQISGMLGVPTGATALSRNLLVNGAMQISQENGRTGVIATGAYPADQWAMAWAGTGFTATAISSLLAAGPIMYPAYVQLYNSGAAKPALAAGDYAYVLQKIEGNRLAGLLWGTANAKPLVLRITMWTNIAGTYSIAIRNAAVTRSYVIPVTLGGAYTDHVFTIPGCTDGVWPTDETAALSVSITGAAGTTVQTTAPNTWATGNFLGHTGMTGNILAANNNAIRFGRVALYLDADGTGLAPPYELPDEAEELRACQRYFHKISNVVGHAFGSGFMVSTTAGRTIIPVSPPLRTAATAVTFSAASDFAFVVSGSSTASAIALSNVGVETVVVDATVAAGTTGQGGYLRGATVNSAISISARM